MRHLGIDYGQRRVGIAVSDEEGKIAFPFSVLKNGKNLISEIKEICEENKIEKIAVGESLDFKGEENAIMKDIKLFVERIKKYIGLPVVMSAEFMTSAQAGRGHGRRVSGDVRLSLRESKNQMLDASAAAIILQSCLDSGQSFPNS